jgi:hypothetical protein
LEEWIVKWVPSHVGCHVGRKSRILKESMKQIKWGQEGTREQRIIIEPVHCKMMSMTVSEMSLMEPKIVFLATHRPIQLSIVVDLFGRITECLICECDEFELLFSNGARRRFMLVRVPFERQAPITATFKGF